MTDTFTFSFEMPERRADAPPPSSKATRRIEAADGEHWFEVRGGGTQVEGAYLVWLGDSLAKAVKAHKAGELDDAAYEAAEVAYHAGVATFIGDRVVDHNLVDYDGDKLPLGLGLFWSMPGRDALTLVGRIQSRKSVWADPKAESDSTNG